MQLVLVIFVPEFGFGFFPESDLVEFLAGFWTLLFIFGSLFGFGHTHTVDKQLCKKADCR